MTSKGETGAFQSAGHQKTDTSTWERTLCRVALSPARRVAVGDRTLDNLS